MSSKRKALRISLIISCIYVGLGSMQLLSIFKGSSLLFPAELADDFLMPAYMIGFALGFSGGSFMAIIGQLLTFAFVCGFFYLLFLLIYKRKRRNSKKQ